MDLVSFAVTDKITRGEVADIVFFSPQGGVGNRVTARSKYGTKKPKAD